MHLLRKTVLFPPFVVFLAIMIVVVIGFIMSFKSIKVETTAALDEYIQSTEDAIQDRFNIYEEMLRAGVGLFAASDEVAKEDWKNFVSTTAINERYTGAQGIGYAQAINYSDLEYFLNFARSKIKNDFRLFPTEQRDFYTSIIYIEPSNGQNDSVVGYDMFSEPVRRAAMAHARDTGDVTISDSVELIQESAVDKQAGFLMYAPQYARNSPTETVDQRRASLRGYVYTAFRSRTYISNALQAQPEGLVGYAIYSDVNGAELYKSSNFNQIATHGHDKKIIVTSMNGAKWRFEYIYDSTDILPSAVATSPRSIAFFGTLVALTIAVTTLLLLRSKADEQLLLQERNINEAKDNLLSIASHQLRTPATGVKQYLGLVIQGFAGDISPRQSELLHKAYQSNERQLKTINDVLYLARISSGRMIISKAKIDIGAVIISTIDELSEQIETNEHTIKTILPKKKVSLFVDEHMFRIALENLLTNAIKYTKHGGNIEIKLKKSAKTVSISVKDNGVGINLVDQQLLFKEFTRINNELSHVVSGTGIGLYLAKHLTTLHDGEIKVVSEVGIGSTFTIILPTIKQ